MTFFHKKYVNGIISVNVRNSLTLINLFNSLHVWKLCHSSDKLCLDLQIIEVLQTIWSCPSEACMTNIEASEEDHKDH